MRVLIYEPDAGGHHFDFVRLILPVVRELASAVVIGTSQAGVDSEQYRILLAPALKPTSHDRPSGAVTIDPGIRNTVSGKSVLIGQNSLLSNSLFRAEEFVRCVRRTRPDHVVVPYADGLAQALVLRRALLRGSIADDPLTSPARPGTITSDALFVRGAVAYPAGSVKRSLVVRASWRLMQRVPHSHMFHLDPLMLAWIARHHPKLICREPGQGGWSLMPDPTPTFEQLSTTEARERMGIPTDGLIVGAAGVMDSRKGIDLLIRSFARARLPAETRLLLVGKQDGLIRSMLKPNGEAGELVKSGRIIAIDRFVEIREFGWALQAMDLVVTPYLGHLGSASIVIKAAAVGRPVLGSNIGWVDNTIRRFGLGSTCQVKDADAFAGALERSLEGAPAWKLHEAGRRFVRFHSEENFQRSWAVSLRHRLGLPQSEHAVAWSWVEEAAEKPPINLVRRGGPASWPSIR